METLAVTPFGTLRGLDRPSALVFKGIRYASAKRFDRPTPITSWEGEYDATRYGAQCHQTMGMMEQALGASSLPMDDDCLFLNVFTAAADDQRRPVLVWIHGGAFTNGAGSVPWYDGSSLVERGGVVVVTINYRLGAFGFAGRDNLGVRDMVVALEWVQTCISSLGGDPGNVTIFGESAGGSAVIALMATASAGGLFHRVMAMSPSIGQLRSGERADEALGELLAAADAASLAELVDAPAERVLAAQSAMTANAGAGFTGFSPCDDGELIAQPILGAATVNPVTLVIGTTRDEMNLFNAFNPKVQEITLDGVVRLATIRFHDRAHQALSAYRSDRPGITDAELFSALQTDAVFRVPARQLAEARCAAGSPTWMYWFTWATPAFGGLLGACHALDVPFVFHNLDRRGVEMLLGDAPDRTLVADQLSCVVIELATRGMAGWPTYDLDARTTQRIDVTSDLLNDPEPAIRVAWETLSTPAS